MATSSLLCSGNCSAPLWVMIVTTLVSTPNPAPGTFRLLATIMSMFFLFSLAVEFSTRSRVSIEKPQTNSVSGHTDDSFAVLALLARIRDEEGVPFIPSLMSQFTPFHKAAEHNLGRRITTYEYRKVIDEAVRLGLTDGYMQEKSSAREEYTPPFDLEGV